MITRSQQKHQAIVETAKSLFLTQGFNLTSMDQIAQAANVSKKTVYHHFTDKVALFKTILAEHWQAVIDSEIILFHEKKSIADNLIHFSRKFWEFLELQETKDLFRLLIAEGPHFPDLLQAIILNNHGPFSHQLLAYLTEQVEQKHLQIANIEMVAYQLLGCLREYHFWIGLIGVPVKLEKSKIEEYIQNSVQMFLSYYSKK